MALVPISTKLDPGHTRFEIPRFLQVLHPVAATGVSAREQYAELDDVKPPWRLFCTSFGLDFLPDESVNDDLRSAIWRAREEVVLWQR
ncbi:MAG: hypothetical protein JXA57_00255 [Armatimonadetes bacterium]|nr:hypothetical protein [Armatimonadota bacterium]